MYEVGGSVMLASGRPVPGGGVVNRGVKGWLSCCLGVL